MINCFDKAMLVGLEESQFFYMINCFDKAMLVGLEESQFF
jgi:hypothetical protein